MTSKLNIFNFTEFLNQSSRASQNTIENRTTKVFSDWSEFRTKENFIIIYHPYAHCSYLDIYISQNLELCKGDFAGKFQIILQAKGINLLHFVALFHVASLFSAEKVGVDNEKALELENRFFFFYISV